MVPELLVVSGPNACGKSTFIHSNHNFFEKNKFAILIPDELDAQFGSYNDTPVTNWMRLYQKRKSNVVYESLLQNPEVIRNVRSFRDLGYQCTLFQFFVESEDASMLRVHDRAQKGGRTILPMEVRTNFKENFENVITNHWLFNEIIFIDSTDFMQLKIVAAYSKMKMVYYGANRSEYIRDMIEKILYRCDLNENFITSFSANKDFGKMPSNKLTELLNVFVSSRVK